MGVRSATARSARSACRPVASGSPSPATRGRIPPSADALSLRLAVCTQSLMTSLSPASLRWRSTTRASAGLSSTNNNRMFLISNSLVLIGAFLTQGLRDNYPRRWRPHPGTAPHVVISATIAKSLRNGVYLPLVPTRITYRPGSARLNPAHGGIARLCTKFSVGAIQTRTGLPILWRQAYDESRRKNLDRPGAGSDPADGRVVRSPSGGVADIHACRPDLALRIRPLAVCFVAMPQRSLAIC